jgi:hypothetical protein
LEDDNLTKGWAKRKKGTTIVDSSATLVVKNRLAAADAKLVEDAFEEHRLSELAPSVTGEAADDAAPRTHVAIVEAHETLAKGNDDLDQAEGIEKSVLIIATPRRYRNPEHLGGVAASL